MGGSGGGSIGAGLCRVGGGVWVVGGGGGLGKAVSGGGGGEGGGVRLVLESVERWY